MRSLSLLRLMDVYNLILKTLFFFLCKYEFWNLQLVLVTWYEARQDTKNVASTYFEFHMLCLPCRNEPQNRCDQCLQEMFYSSTELYTKNKFSGGLRASCRFVFLPWLCRKQNQQVHEIIKFRINFIYPSSETDKILKLTKKAKQSVKNSVAKLNESIFEHYEIGWSGTSGKLLSARKWAWTRWFAVINCHSCPPFHPSLDTRRTRFNSNQGLDFKSPLTSLILSKIENIELF